MCLPDVAARTAVTRRPAGRARARSHVGPGVTSVGRLAKRVSPDTRGWARRSPSQSGNRRRCMCADIAKIPPPSETEVTEYASITVLSLGGCETRRPRRHGGPGSASQVPPLTASCSVARSSRIPSRRKSSPPSGMSSTPRRALSSTCKQPWHVSGIPRSTGGACGPWLRVLWASPAPDPTNRLGEASGRTASPAEARPVGQLRRSRERAVPLR